MVMSVLPQAIHFIYCACVLWHCGGRTLTAELQLLLGEATFSIVSESDRDLEYVDQAWPNYEPGSATWAPHGDADLVETLLYFHLTSRRHVFFISRDRLFSGARWVRALTTVINKVLQKNKKKLPDSLVIHPVIHMKGEIKWNDSISCQKMVKPT